MLTVLVATYMSMMTISWTIPFIILQLILWKFKLHVVTESGQVALILKKLPKRSSITKDGNLSCWIWGYEYIGFIFESSENSSRQIYLYTTEKYFEHLTSSRSKALSSGSSSGESSKNTSIVNILDRCGSFSYLYYLERKINLIHLTPNSNQQIIVDNIMSHYNKSTNLSKTTIVWLYGQSGAGKSTVSIILTKMLKGTYCDTFKPTYPGDTLQKCYNAASPSEDNPFVLVIEEADTMFDQIHNNKIIPHSKIPIFARTKGEINSLFDKIKNGLFPYMLIMMTSNISPDVLTKTKLGDDKSYLRDGRVDLYINLSKKDGDVRISTPEKHYESLDFL